MVQPLPYFFVPLLVLGYPGPSPEIVLNNGVKMPVIGAGTGAFSNATAYASILSALKLGFTHVDTAHDYYNQDGVGKAIAQFDRKSFFLTTKVPGCGVPGQGIDLFHCYEDTKKLFEEDLILLNVEYVDLMLLHFPPILGCKLGCQPIQEQWKALEDLYAQGKTRAIGVSNYCQSCFSCLNETMKVKPAVNQIKYHVGMGPDPIDLISYCKSQDIVVQAYSPLASGSPHIIHGNLTGSIGEKYNKSSVQIALKWIVQKGFAVQTGSANPKESLHFYARPKVEIICELLELRRSRLTSKLENSHIETGKFSHRNRKILTSKTGKFSYRNLENSHVDTKLHIENGKILINYCNCSNYVASQMRSKNC
ncbi:hypothetical protein AAMO2058_001426800 [Amorphochlora amoebiformis]